MLEIHSFGNSHIGRVRSTNQDSFLADSQLQLFIVADGMGGHAGGEIASRLCTDEVSRFLAEHLPPALEKAEKLLQHPERKILTVLAQAVNHASTKIYEKALEEPNLRGMGTTATVVKVIDDYAYFAHVGDSRFYLIRQNFIYQMTNDHSLVGEQVRAGYLSKEEAELHHLRNVITRSVGFQEEEDVDTGCIKLEKHDILILCSDGLHGKVSEQEISLTASKGREASVDSLIAKANAQGGEDNITTVIIRVA